MKVKVNQRLKRLISGLAAAATATAMLPTNARICRTGSTTYSYDWIYDVEYSRSETQMEERSVCGSQGKQTPVTILFLNGIQV